MNRPREYMWNPWEWFKWFYETVGHKNPALSAWGFVIAFAVIGWLVWWRLDTQYRKDHPVFAATQTLPAPPVVTPEASKSEPAKPKEKDKKKNEAKQTAPGEGGINAPGGTIVQQNNQGSSGNNRQEVIINQGSQPRRIPDEKRSAMIDLLKSAAGTQVLVYGAQMGEKESRDLYNQIGSVFSDAGWNVSMQPGALHSTIGVSLGPDKFFDLAVGLYGVFPMTDAPPVALAHQAFKSVGIELLLFGGNGLDLIGRRARGNTPTPQVFTIIVGKRPD